MAVNMENAKKPESDEIQELPFVDSWIHDSLPLDIGMTDFMSLVLSPLMPLKWNKIPVDMTVKNMGYMLNFQVEYTGQRPRLNGSVLQCPYEFWGFYFHCGSKNDGGNEQRVMGKLVPMEIHLVFYNISYTNTDEALAGKNGVLVLVYACKLEPEENSELKDLTLNLNKIKKPGKMININPFSLSSLFGYCLTKYLMFWSAGRENDRKTPILWIISSKTIPISESQLSQIQSLRRLDKKCVGPNCLESRPPGQRYTVFNVQSESLCEMESPTTSVMDNAAIHVTNTTDIVTNFVTVPTQCTEYELETTIPDNNEHEVSVAMKDVVIRSIDSLLTDLQSDTTKADYRADCSQEVPKTHREGVRMNSTALRRELHIKNRLQKKLEHKNRILRK